MDGTNQVSVKIERLSDSFQNNDADNEIKIPFVNYIKQEIENDADLEALSINNEDIKIELDDTNVKKECFGNLDEVLLELKNQSPDAAVGEEKEFHLIDIKNILRGTEYCKSVHPDLSAVQNEEVDGSRSEYKCDSCEKVFTNESHLKLHKCIHMNSKLYSCDICEKTFSWKSNLNDHRRLHSGKKPYSCNICKKLFTRNRTLIEHKRLHTGEKPYICDVCEKSFSLKKTLTDHKRIHTGDRPYSCNVCKKTFVQKSHLNRHLLQHTSEKPYTYVVCNKSFVTESFKLL